MQNYAMSQNRGAPAPCESHDVSTVEGVDKYSLLTDLQVMARELGLKPAPLSVLAALCSFHPGRLIDESVVIFAGNAALSSRLHGIPESTLRRHLKTLCDTGLIARRDSPNRKRYTRQAGDDRIAFGFSLAPFVQAAEMIAARAAELRLEDARLHIRLEALKARLAQVKVDEETLARLKRRTRLAPTPARLDEIETALEAFCSQTSVPISTVEVSGSAAQNKRHYKNSIQNTTSLPENNNGQDPVPQATQSAKKYMTRQHLSISNVLRKYESALAFASIPPKSWQDLTQLAHDLAPSLGLSRTDWHQALTKLGTERAAILVLSLVAKAPNIAHLPSYTRAAMAGALRNNERAPLRIAAAPRTGYNV